MADSMPGADDRTDRWTAVGLLAAGLVGVLAVLPYQFTLTGWPAPETLPLIIGVAVVENGVLLGLAILAGSRLGGPLGLVVVRPREELRRSRLATYGRAASYGLVVGVVIIGLDAVVFAPFVQGAVLGGATLPTPPVPGGVAGLGLLASLYGGITEELFLRFGLLSLLAWVGWRLVGRPSELPAQIAWSAIVVTAILFGIGHLGATAAVFALTPAVLTRMVVLNGVAGVVFGWLYWRVDLTTAMVAHFAADIVLHVVAAGLA